MMCFPLVRTLRSAFRAWAERAPARAPGRRPVLEALEDRSLPSAVTTIATLGDSLTAPYPPSSNWGAAGDQSWAQQLAANGGKHLAIDNLAVPGMTSSDVLNGQVPTAAHLISTGAVHYATLIVGANDALDFLPALIQGDSGPFVQEVTANIEASLNTLEGAGDVGLAVGDLPDIGLTPGLQFELTQDGIPPAALPFVLQNITNATEAANAEIKSFAAQHDIPVIDLFGLGHLVAETSPAHPITVGGQQINNLYAPDFFHPNTVGQGLLGDAAVEALATAYNPGLDRVRLTDQQILDDAHIAHAPGHSFYDVSSFVLFTQEDGGHHGD